MSLPSLPPELAPWAALAVLLGVFAGFVRERYPAEVVALAGAAAMIVLGLLPYERALGVMANPAPWTIAAMFVLMGALVRTGALAQLTALAERLAERRPRLAIVVVMALVMLASAIVSNTPVVVVMIPVLISLGRKLGLAPSKLLIPLSYAAILGGMLTLIGTSTNLLVDGVARAAGLAPFGLFEVTPLAAILVAWGALYLAFVAPRLLPERSSLAAVLGERGSRRFIAEVAVPEGSALIGRPAGDALRGEPKVRLVDVIRDGRSLRHALGQVRLAAGDRLVLKAPTQEILELQASGEVAPLGPAAGVETTLVEALAGPGCRLIGRKLGEVGLRRRWGVYPLAVHRRNRNISQGLDEVSIELGDTLLLEGPPEGLAAMAREMDLVGISRPTARPYRRRKAPLAVAALLGLVALAGLGAAPILALAVPAVALVLLARCVDADEAFGFVEGRLLVLILSMLAVGAGLEATGAVHMVASALAPGLALLPPVAMIWAVFLLTSVMTEMVSNNAVAVVMTPVVIGLAQELGVEPRPLVVAVMIAASASFATPIGYQTNTLVYGPGGYAFRDFLRVGTPLNLTIGLISALFIPLFWPL